MDKFKSFDFGGKTLSVNYLTTEGVSEGIEADLYSFIGDSTKDLAIIRVHPRHRTPLQKILQGSETIEGYIDGEGILTLHRASGEVTEHVFLPGKANEPVSVNVDDTMQWVTDSGLTFYEVCTPPYEKGRFENL